MKNTKKSLNELNPIEYGAVAVVGGYAIKGIAAVIAAKLMKKYGVFKTAKQFFSNIWNRIKLKQAGVTDNETRALYANGGAAIVDLGRQFSEEVFKKVKAGKLTPQQAVDQLDGIIPDSSKDIWLKRFETIYSGSRGTAKSAVKYTKIAGSILPKDTKFEKAVARAYGSTNKVDELYATYQRAFNSGKLAIPFKEKAVFPSKQEWLDLTGWKPQNANIGLNDKLIAQNNAYNWQKFIWALYR